MHEPDQDATPEPPPPAARRAQRLMLLGAGYACLGLAVLGAVLPLLDTSNNLVFGRW
jgi:hypothetical protein